MNREEVIAVFEKIKVNYEADPDWGVYDGVFSRRNLTEILDAYATLLCPKPNPDTGLVPCGCGGRADCNDLGIVTKEGERLWWVECTGCGISTYGHQQKDEAKAAWNRAMGYREEG